MESESERLRVLILDFKEWVNSTPSDRLKHRLNDKYTDAFKDIEAIIGNISPDNLRIIKNEFGD